MVLERVAREEAEGGRRAGGRSDTARVTRDEIRNARALRRSWAQLIKRIYEVDPLVCPRCQGEMCIIAFIVDPEVVDMILRHLAHKPAEPLRGSPPSSADLASAS